MKCSLFSNERTLLYIFSVFGSPKCTNVHINGPIYIVGNKLAGSSSKILMNCYHVIAHVSGLILCC